MTNDPAVDIPKKYKAAVYDKPGTVSTKVVELDTPEPGPGQVLIRLTHSGVCHSDFGIMTNSWKALPHPTAPGQVGGHEGVGVIAKLGPGLDKSPVQVGQRVGVKWVSGVCNTCANCLGGFDAQCSNAAVSGYYTPGTFQQYVLGPASYVTPIPDGVDSAMAAPMLCAGVTVYSALLKSQVKGGEWLVVSGAGGGLGHIACQIASRGMGMRVIGIDHGSKKDVAEESGCEVFIDFTQVKDVKEEVLRITGGVGAHGAMVLTAANPAYAQALTMLRVGGTLVAVGIPEGDLVPIATASPNLIINKSLRIVGSAVGSRKEAIETLAFAARGVAKTHYKLAKMEELTQVFKDMEEGKIMGRVVLDLE